MLHAAALLFVLSFAPPAEPPADAEVVGAEIDDAEIDDATDAEVDMDPRLAATLAGLSADAQQRLAAASEAELDALIGQHFDGTPMHGADAELAAALAGYQLQTLDAELNYQTGDVAIGQGLATLHLGETFRYLPPDDARKVIVDVWGNPPEAGDTLGMIVPAGTNPAHPQQGWGVIVTYTEDGHVEDDDAQDIDYDDLLAEMQTDTRDANADRTSRGFPAMTLVGWAAAPHYDAETKRLYWAKELDVDGAPEHTLNYDIRVLGRKGVLELSAIGGIAQLDEIRPAMEQVLSTVEFDAGNRYGDFDPDIDAVAAYGIGGLVAGKLLAKAGLFAVLLKFLIAGKKLLLVGVLAVGVFMKKLFSRGAKEE